MVHCTVGSERRMLLFRKISENLRHGTTNLAISANRTARPKSGTFYLHVPKLRYPGLKRVGDAVHTVILIGAGNQACLAPLSATNLACYRTRDCSPLAAQRPLRGAPDSRPLPLRLRPTPQSPCQPSPKKNTLRVLKLASLANSSRHCSDPQPLRPPSPPSRRVPR